MNTLGDRRNRWEERVDPALLGPVIRRVRLEMTSRCNIRCIYCPVSQPEYHGLDLALERDPLVDQLARLHPWEIEISGHGETTMLPDWNLFAEGLIVRGLRLTMTTNLAKRLSPKEVRTLARFHALKVSCDTADPVLFSRLRRGAKLSRVEDNLRAVRKASTKSPHIQISCTLMDAVVPGLPHLVDWAANLALHGVSLVNLERYPDLPGEIPVRHPVEVDPKLAITKIREARIVARERGIAFNVIAGLEQALEDACAPCR